MRRQTHAHPDQLPLDLTDEQALERIIAARVAERAEAASFIWRFRLVCIETVLIGTLVAIAGVILGQPAMMVLRATVLIAVSCFASGLLLIVLSAWSSRLLARWQRWRTS